MQKFILSTASAALAAVGVLSALAAAPVSAAQIYPVDQARFMTNAKFDFKIELDKKADRKNVVVEINGADYKKVLKGSEIWVPEEIDSEGSALIMRDVEIKKPGKYTVVVKSPEGEMRADWDLYSTPKKAAAKNVIILLADGLSVGHRTAARILSKGVKNGMYQAPLAMDNMPHMALLGTSSVDTIAADSANTASAYMTGHKSSVNALGVYADRTKASQDDPRQETIAELLRRKTGKAIGVVSDAEIEDATPASVVAHTRRRSDKADIVGMFYEVRPEVILGGGSAYFLPQGTPGSKRKDSTNYLELFQKDGYKFVSDRTELLAAVDGKAPQKLLGLFHTGNMDGWIDRHQWKGNTVKKFPNQPDLTDAFDAAVKVLGQNKEGFFLMLEAGLVDKFSHPLDWTRSVGDTIAFDKVVERAQKYVDEHPDTLLIVTGDHTHSISVAATISPARTCVRKWAFMPMRVIPTTLMRTRTASRMTSHLPSVWPSSSAHTRIITKPIAPTRIKPSIRPSRTKRASMWLTKPTSRSRAVTSSKETCRAMKARAFTPSMTWSLLPAGRSLKKSKAS